MNRILEHHKSITRPVAIILAYPALDFNFTSWMSPSNLRVLQTEQSETHIPGLLHGKDHMRHKTPLSVVDDVGKKSKRPAAKSRKSWADSISATFGMSMTPSTPKGSKTQPSSPLTMTRPLSKRTESGWFASREEGVDSAPEDVSDMSSSDDEDDDEYKPDRRRDADKSLAERVKTPGVLADERFTDGILSASPAQVAPEDGPLAPAVAAAVRPKPKAAFATRLTMTSRVGYFQDRVISPSMMRAMAILYIGPQRCPDFETDYYISPILSPAENLAHFPPVYLICGERDPFVDDTVIFAGKLREAKRTRRSQAANGSETKSGKFGEGLRMTTGKPNEDIPDHILRETDEDWVQMRIIEGWGHGFMQMSALMREVDSVLVEMADWIDESFERNRLLEKDKEDVAAAHAAARAAFAPDTPVHQTTQDTLPSPLRSRHVKPVREYTVTPKDKPVGDADLGVDFGRDSDNEDNIVTFTPKTKKRTPPPSQFNPVPRRPSRDVLKRENSALNFDSLDDTGSSGETVVLRTPPLGRVALPTTPAAPKGMASFGLFSRPSNTTRGPVALNKTPATSLYGPTVAGARRGSSPVPTLHPSSNNPLVKAAVASARAASPALAAAGFVPQSINSLDPEEMYRRRRAEAVFGMEMPDDDHGNDK